MTLLRNISNGLLPSNIILIEDTVECDGLPLLLCFMKGFTDRYEHVHLFCTDCTTALLLKRFENLIQNRVTCHQVFDDPAGWTSGDRNGFGYSTDLFSYLKHFQGVERSAKSYAVVIDSLSLLLLNSNLGSVCRMLQNLQKYSSYLGGRESQLVCLLHTDVHEEIVVKSIEHLATCVVHVQPTRQNSLNNISTSTIYKSPGGKITRELSQCTLSYETLDIREEIVQTNSQQRKTENQVHQLASKLTFSVALRDSEKQSRAQLVLPYEKIAGESPNSSGGKIIYEPDEADDYDDEDPDDDLDV